MKTRKRKKTPLATPEEQHNLDALLASVALSNDDLAALIADVGMSDDDLAAFIEDLEPGALRD